MLDKIISGGQTGVDRAALDAALELGIPCGGFVPKGRLAEDGPLPDKYPVQECDSEKYAVRTDLNVLHSDATLILYRKELQGGTHLTYELCRKHAKPCITINLDNRDSEEVKAMAHKFFQERNPKVLNVAGPRESISPGIYAKSLNILRLIFREEKRFFTSLQTVH